MAGIDLLAIEPHKISRDLSGYIIYIYGMPKIGKTSLAVQAPDALLIATEKGYNAIPGIRAIDVPDWRTMRKILVELRKPEVKAQYKTLIIDTIDLAAEYVTKYICDLKSVEDLSDIGWGKAYKAMRVEFAEVFRTMAQLGYAVIFLSHVNYWEDEDTHQLHVGPTLSPDKVNAIITNMADIYGWAHYSDDEEAPSKRVLTLRSDDDAIACGTRFAYLPDEIPFSYQSLVSELRKAIEVEAELTKGELVTDESDAAIADKEQETLDELIEQFKDMVNTLKENVSAKTFKTKWGPFITSLLSKHLGEGMKITEALPTQVEQVGCIVDDLQEEMGNGI